MTVTATLSQALAEAVSIPLTVTPGTAEDTDYGTLPAIAIAAGETTGTSAMTTAMDLDGDDETFTVALDADNLPSGVTAGAPASKTVTIDDTVTGETVSPVVFPNPPAIVEATPGDGQVTLAWSGVAGAQGWEVERDGSRTWTATGGAETGHTVTGLDNGTAYSFRVRATGLLPALKGTASASVSATPAPQTAPATAEPAEPTTAPDPVGAVTVTHNGSSLTVSWDAPARATHYDVTYTNTGNGETGRAAWNRAGTTLTITCDVRAGYENRHCIGAGATYTVGVRARNAAGESAWANSSATEPPPAQPETPEATTPPDAVGAITVTHKGSSLEVTWDASARATHYDVTYTNTGNGETGRAAWNRAGTTLTITCDVRTGYENRHCIGAGATYTVGVRARNAAGESTWANSASASQAPQAQSPPDPVGSVTVTHNGGNLTVTWDAPARATHYDVTYTNTGNGENARAAWNRAGTTLTITCDIRTGYENRHCIGAGATYTVGVRARNAAGESTWANSASASASGPALSVSDTTVAEGAGATLDFAVTLSRAASGTVTVAWATSDGTAVAGSDYTSASGTLTFAAGDTSKTVSVAILDDAHDEGSETMTLTLSNASGATISDGQATGTITNADPLQRDWLARFGRAAAADAVAAVTARLETPRDAGSHLTVGGYRFALDGAGDKPNLSATAGGPGGASWPSWSGEPSGDMERTMSGRELLMGTSFRAVLRGRRGRAVDGLGPGRVGVGVLGHRLGAQFERRDRDRVDGHGLRAGRSARRIRDDAQSRRGHGRGRGANLRHGEHGDDDAALCAVRALGAGVGVGARGHGLRADDP